MNFYDQINFTREKNLFMGHCGIQVVELTREKCVVERTVTEACKNTADTVHGGLFYTMADCAASAYGRAVYRTCVTLDSSFRFLSNVREGRITAEAVPVQVGGRVLVMDATVRQGERVLAAGSFTIYRTGK